MEINRVNGRGTYKYETKKIVGKKPKKKSFITAPLYTPSDFFAETSHGVSLKAVMKELWKYVKKGANFLKSKALHVFKG
jgi:hypothetical protein